jgi:hypothetical protein
MNVNKAQKREYLVTVTVIDATQEVGAYKVSFKMNGKLTFVTVASDAQKYQFFFSFNSIPFLIIFHKN